MTDELSTIDTEAIEELAEIREEQAILDERLERMEEKRDTVSEDVYDRVRTDYESRRERLEEEARPLAESARGEYERLREVHERARDDLAEARLDREEVEFRHELGELDDEELEERLEGVVERIEEGETDLAEVEEVRERFLAALGSEPEPGPGGVEWSSDEGEYGTKSLEIETPGWETPSEEEALGSEGLEGPIGSNEESEAPPGGDAVPEEDLDETQIITRPRFLIYKGEDWIGQYTLAEDRVGIGRDADNQLHLLGDSISRHHAEVVRDGGHFEIQDLGSENGTFVNGEVADSHELSDGDVVHVGSHRLVFRGM